MRDAVAEHFEGQARASDELGSPFTAELCRLLAARLDDSSSFGRRILGWPGEPRADVLALRACGALHALARSGRVPALTAAYPPAAVDREALWSAITATLAGHDAELAAWLDSAPQTNEVARSAMILGAALTTADLLGLPLAVYEIGASAGLNLAFDEYRYDLGGGHAWVPANAPLTVACDWRGDIPPLAAPLRVASRAGCDVNPLDATSAVDAARLTAYIWPDQVHRLARLEAALQHAATSHREVARADAGAWLAEQLARPAAPGTCRFVYHTVVRQYLPASAKAQVDAALARAAAASSPDRPLAHFSFEPDGTDPGGAMTLRLWPGDRTIPLGRADYHGRWAIWAGA